MFQVLWTYWCISSAWLDSFMVETSMESTSSESLSCGPMSCLSSVSSVCIDYCSLIFNRILCSCCILFYKYFSQWVHALIEYQHGRHLGIASPLDQYLTSRAWEAMMELLFEKEERQNKIERHEWSLHVFWTPKSMLLPTTIFAINFRMGDGEVGFASSSNACVLYSRQWLLVESKFDSLN